MIFKVLDIQQAREVYEHMDQTQLLQLKQAFENDLVHNIDTEYGVLFAGCRINIIEQILEERDEMKSMTEKLKAAKKRNPDAYKIIGVVSGFGEKKIREIAEGTEMSPAERVILEGLSEMEG